MGADVLKLNMSNLIIEPTRVMNKHVTLLIGTTKSDENYQNILKDEQFQTTY